MICLGGIFQPSSTDTVITDRFSRVGLLDLFDQRNRYGTKIIGLKIHRTF